MPSNILIKNDEYLVACIELYQSQKSILCFEEYSSWLERHNELFKSFVYPPVIKKEQSAFYFLYVRIKQFKEFLQYSDNSKEAVERYPSSGYQDEIAILRWLSNYEELGKNLLLFSEFLNDRTSDSIGYLEFKGLKFSSTDFEHIIKFKQLFDIIYWEMLDRYSIEPDSNNSE